MRILHITPDYVPSLGGGEFYVKEVSERLAARGRDVTVLAMNSRGARASEGRPLPVSEELNGVHLKRLLSTYSTHQRLLALRGAHRALSLAVGRTRWQVLSMSPYSLQAFLQVVTGHFDVVGVFNWYHGSLAYQTAVARSLRRFAFVGIPLFHTERPWAHFPLLERALARCDAVVAMTAHEKQFVESRSGRANAEVIGAGVEPALFANADGRRIRARYGLGDAPIVGYIGRLSSHKGVVTLVDAMRAVWRTMPDARLLLAGGGAPPAASAEPEVRRAFDALTDDERARMVVVNSPSEDDKRSMFDAIDLFVMTSVAESFGITYLEAWTRGKPVIGSRMGSTECVIRDGVDGLLVEPGKPGELAAAIARLLADTSMRERLGAAGHAKTLGGYTWDKVVDRVDRTYVNACAELDSRGVPARPVA